jgi:hypothetical protein
MDEFFLSRIEFFQQLNWCCDKPHQWNLSSRIKNIYGCAHIPIQDKQ